MTAEQIRPFLVKVLVKKGMYAFEAEMVADRLLDADALGRTAAGCVTLQAAIHSINMGDIDPRAIALPKGETAAVSFINANEGMGQVSATAGMEAAIKKAREVGIGLVVVGNSQSLGCPLVYARLAALQGMIGLCLTSTADKMVSEAGNQGAALLGRQPFAFAIPAPDRIVGYECALSSDAGANVALPKELASSLGLLHAVLTCGLTGERIPSEKTRGPHLERTEHFLLAINPTMFAGPEKLGSKVSALETWFQESGLPVGKYPLTPETAHPLSDETLTALQKIAEQEKVAWPE